MTVRVAVIGAGVMGSDHARILSDDVPGAVLQVVCDTLPERARSVADACGAVDVTSDPEAVVARGDVDAVLVASPDETHVALTLAAIAAGKPVLCEKPLAPTAEQSLQVVAAESRCGRRLVQVGFMRRFDPFYTEMKAALDDGRIGAPMLMHNVHRNVAAPPFFRGDMAITNSAPHEFDAIRFILGTEISAISAFQPARDEPSRVGPVFMVMETRGGQLATAEINNNAAYGYDVRGELVGAQGAVSLGTPALARFDSDLRSATTYAADWRARFAEAYRLQDKSWLRGIETGMALATAATAWDGYCAAAVAEAGVEALSSGGRVSVEIVEKPALYAREGPVA